jgi:galactonate dehydratase
MVRHLVGLRRGLVRFGAALPLVDLLAAGIPLAASIPNFLCQEQVSLGDGYLKTPFVVRNGYIDIPTGPGLGVELDEKALAKQLEHNWRNRETYDEDDGSVVDW